MYGARPLPGEETRPLPYWQKYTKLTDIYPDEYFNQPMSTSAAFRASKKFPNIDSTNKCIPYPYPYLYPSFLKNSTSLKASTNNYGSSRSVFNTVF